MGLDQFFDVQSIEHLINFLKKTSPNEKSIYYIPRKILDKKEIDKLQRMIFC